MVIVESVLGNIKDPVWQHKLAKAAIDKLVLNQWDSQKNRFRRVTEQGQMIAVSLERNAFLQDGDILIWDAASNLAVIAKIDLRDVLVIDLKSLVNMDKERLVRTCIELGHALGNQHWPAVIKEQCVYVPLTVDKKVMLSVMKTYAFQDVTYDFIPGIAVIPYLAPHETRRLFGGAEQALHKHSTFTDGHSSSHSHENSHSR